MFDDAAKGFSYGLMFLRKETLRSGPVFSLLTVFVDSSNAFAEISLLRHLLNFSAKTLNVASKTAPDLGFPWKSSACVGLNFPYFELLKRYQKDPGLSRISAGVSAGCLRWMKNPRGPGL
jgi:hypothetical protein